MHLVVVKELLLHGCRGPAHLAHRVQRHKGLQGSMHTREASSTNTGYLAATCSRCRRKLCCAAEQVTFKKVHEGQQLQVVPCGPKNNTPQQALLRTVLCNPDIPQHSPAVPAAHPVCCLTLLQAGGSLCSRPELTSLSRKLLT